MFRETKPNGCAPRAHDMEGVLRHPDGSVDIAAYAKLAHRERTAAIAAAARKTIGMLRKMFLAIRSSLAPAVRSEPAAGQHRAAAGRCTR